MTRTATPRRPRASSQARIAVILTAARELLAEQGMANLSIYSVAERAGIPPSSVYHFFASVPALLEGLTADVHAAFRASLQEPVEHAYQDTGVERVQTHGGLVEHEQAAGLVASELGGELEALGLPAGQGRSVLPEGEIAEPEVDEGLQLAAYLRHRFEHLAGLKDGEGEQLGERVAAVRGVEDDVLAAGRVAGATAVGAGDVDVGQELHVQHDLSGALAARAAQRPGVVGEVGRGQSPGLRGVGRGERAA